MPFDLGDVVPLSISVYDAAGVPTNVGTITLTITLPNGTTVTPVVTNPPATTGVYSVDYVPAVSGRYDVRWTSLGPQSAHTDAFDVRPVTPLLMFSLRDGKTTLNITTSTHDEEIRDLIESTTAAVEYLTGPIVRQTVIERHNGGSTIVLRESPVISLTSIGPVLASGTTYNVNAVDLDNATGVLQLLDGSSFTGQVLVTFVAGRTIIPAALRDAGRMILKHLWSIQNGPHGGLPSFSADTTGDFTVIPGLGYSLPNRALELLQPYVRPPKVG
jgi:hypothetical protein